MCSAAVEKRRRRKHLRAREQEPVPLLHSVEKKQEGSMEPSRIMPSSPSVFVSRKGIKGKRKRK
jgi:hypothetical protein